MTVVDTARELCEAGYDVTFWMISAWPSSQERDRFERRLRCTRQEAIPLFFMDHFNKTISGKLAYQHRWVVERELENHDFFISIEDDMKREKHTHTQRQTERV